MRIFFALIFFLLSFFALGKEAELTLLTENAPPNNYTNKEGKLVGGAAVIIQELIKRTNHQGDIEVLPWPRAINAFKKRTIPHFFAWEGVPKEKIFFYGWARSLKLK